MQINYLPLLLSGTLLCSGQTTAIADPTLDSTGSPAYLKILAQPAEPWSKISEKQRFDLYASLNFSPYAGLSSMASAAISQAIDSPHEWGEGWGPYGVRIASIPQLRVHQILDTTLVSGIDRGQSRRLQRHQRLTGFISCAFRQGEIGPTAVAVLYIEKLSCGLLDGSVLFSGACDPEQAPTLGRSPSLVAASTMHYPLMFIIGSV